MAPVRTADSRIKNFKLRDVSFFLPIGPTVNKNGSMLRYKVKL